MPILDASTWHPILFFSFLGEHLAAFWVLDSWLVGGCHNHRSCRSTLILCWYMPLSTRNIFVLIHLKSETCQCAEGVGSMVANSLLLPRLWHVIRVIPYTYTSTRMAYCMSTSSQSWVRYNWFGGPDIRTSFHLFPMTRQPQLAAFKRLFASIDSKVLPGTCRLRFPFTTFAFPSSPQVVSL